MVFGLRVKKWKDRKYNLYKFTFMPLIDKKITNKKKNTNEQKFKSTKSVQRRTKKAKEGSLFFFFLNDKKT